MAVHVFGVRTVESEEVDQFFSFSASRAAGVGIHEFFARWLIAPLPSLDDGYARWAVSVSSSFPDAWKIAAAIALLPLLFTGLVWSWWVVPGLVMWLLSFFASASFRYLVVRMGLRRWGYEGSIKRLGVDEVVSILLEYRAEVYHGSS